MKFPLKLPKKNTMPVNQEIKNSTVEQRLQVIKNFYINAGKIIDRIPIPDELKQKIKNGIFNDSELSDLMDSIDSHRPPRIFLIGRTGMGKSSLINAMCGSYMAYVSDVESQRPNTNIYQIKDGNRVLMEIFDTRGISESQAVDENISSEELLANQIKAFSPDVAVLMLNATHKDSVNEDACFLKNIADEYKKSSGTELPVVVVINKCDQVQPDNDKNPARYAPKKLENIEKITAYYKQIIDSNKLSIQNIVPVSSFIHWQDKDGNELDAETINNMPYNSLSELQIGFDGRYNIENLRTVLENSIVDVDAQRGLKMAFNLNELIQRLAKRMNVVFSGIASAISLTPIPIADLYVLLTLQALLVTLIVLLSGREISIESAMEFIFSMGGVAAAGNVFRLAAHQLVKLIPVGGSAISAAIAYAGTYAIGKAAVSYYIDGKDIKEVKKTFNKDKKSIENNN